MSSCPARRRARTLRGFTLIELLVVIAIIAILAAILFPVFARVREKANQTSCLNNQRQLAVALMIYANDHEETLPLPSTWVEATNLASDPKIFNCPSNSAQGVPSAPDYGMNAFLYDLDPLNGSVAGVSMGEITDPTKIELTSDLARLTAPTVITLAPSNPNYYKQVIKQEMTNPFPESYTVTGFGGGGSGIARHGGQAATSFVDGHVALQSGMTLGAGMSGYNIPRSGGRMYVRFADTQNYADARERLHAAVAWDVPGPYDTVINSAGIREGVNYHQGNPTSDLNFSPAAGWKITGPGNMVFGADPNNYIAPGPSQTLMFDGTLSSDAVLLVGTQHPFVNGAPTPATDSPTHDWNSTSKALHISNAYGFVRGGSEQSFAGINYIDYTSPDWIEVPSLFKGKSFPWTSARKIRVEMVMSGSNGACFFPTEPDAYWHFGNTPDKHTFYASTAVNAWTKWRVITTSGNVEYEGPWMALSWDIGNLPRRLITLAQGSLTLKEVLYTGQ